VGTRRRMRVLQVAALLALFGLAMMVWAVLVPTPMPVILAMSVGQGAGTLSFLLYLLVVIADLRHKRIFDEREDR
jgi:peptidoglycan/LPS O-acetylase OafA/YrhL